MHIEHTQTPELKKKVTDTHHIEIYQENKRTNFDRCNAAMIARSLIGISK